MQDEASGRILLTGFAPGEADALVTELKVLGYQVFIRSWSDEVLDLLATVLFNALVVRYPLPGAGFGVLLSSVRAKASLSRGAGFLIVAPPDDVNLLQGLIGRGVNRVLPTNASIKEMVSTIEGIHGVAPRFTLRMPVQLEVQLPSRFLKAYCQTENMSESGMLLRGFSHYPSGTVFSFEVQIPGEDAVIRGTAEITRTTDSGRENLEGFAAKFLEVEQSGQSALLQILGKAVSSDEVN
ncbi:MAG: PilZ domain-containing protein [Thermoanaerobaculales bacterium]|nr:PilZ domain-containing protein [Thermoanaerobaculales bacterium]